MGRARYSCQRAVSSAIVEPATSRTSSRGSIQWAPFMAVVTRRLRLLVVDDEPELAELIAEFGRRAGYEATCTSDPDDFDRLYRDDLDVIVLDLWMPRRDGVELLRHLAERQSRARVILVSGFDERVLASARGLAASYGLNVIGALTKPVRLTALTQLL